MSEGRNATHGAIAEVLRTYAESFASDTEGLHLLPEAWNTLRKNIELAASALVQKKQATHNTVCEKCGARVQSIMGECRRTGCEYFASAVSETAPSTRQKVDAEHRICQHGRDAFADDCGMCELAGTSWAATTLESNAGSGLGAATEPSRRADAKAPTAEAVSSLPSATPPREPEFFAVGYADTKGNVFWEPGRKPIKEVMIYVAVKEKEYDGPR